MLGSKQEKQISKADMEKKVEAWKVINATLVSTNAEYVANLYKLLQTKEDEVRELKTKIESNIGTEEDNATLIFLGGYVQALKDILSAKKVQ